MVKCMVYKVCMCEYVWKYCLASMHVAPKLPYLEIEAIINSILLNAYVLVCGK